MTPVRGTVDEPAYRTFAVRVRRVHALSPSFVRVTFTGDDLDAFADNGADQRINVVLPLESSGLASFPTGADWYERWRALPEEQQNPVRTYTVRAVRPGDAEVDVDFVLHGETGPASRWAARAGAGDPAILVGPNARSAEDNVAVGWAPPPGARRLLVGADETAVPAVAVILGSLPPDAEGVAVLEVPTEADRLPLTHPAGVRLDWRVRGSAEHGAGLDEGVRTVAAAWHGVPTRPGADPGLSDDDLWDVPEEAHADRGIYTWLAGEAGTVARLRRHLVRDLAWDRGAVAFMGYWRL